MDYKYARLRNGGIIAVLLTMKDEVSYPLKVERSQRGE